MATKPPTSINQLHWRTTQYLTVVPCDMSQCPYYTNSYVILDHDFMKALSFSRSGCQLDPCHSKNRNPWCSKSFIHICSTCFPVKIPIVPPKIPCFSVKIERLLSHKSHLFLPKKKHLFLPQMAQIQWFRPNKNTAETTTLLHWAIRLNDRLGTGLFQLLHGVLTGHGVGFREEFGGFQPANSHEGTPKWTLYFRENNTKIHDLGYLGGPLFLRNPNKNGIMGRYRGYFFGGSWQLVFPDLGI